MTRQRNVDHQPGHDERLWRKKREAGFLGSLITLVGVLFCVLFSASMWHDAIGDSWDFHDLPITLMMAVCPAAATFAPAAAGVANVHALRARRAGLPLAGARRLANVGAWLAAIGSIASVGFGGTQLLVDTSLDQDAAVVVGATVMSLLPCLLVLLVTVKTARGISSTDRRLREEIV